MQNFITAEDYAALPLTEDVIRQGQRHQQQAQENQARADHERQERERIQKEGEDQMARRELSSTPHQILWISKDPLSKNDAISSLEIKLHLAKEETKKFKEKTNTFREKINILSDEVIAAQEDATNFHFPHSICILLLLQAVSCPKIDSGLQQGKEERREEKWTASEKSDSSPGREETIGRHGFVWKGWQPKATAAKEWAWESPSPTDPGHHRQETPRWKLLVEFIH